MTTRHRIIRDTPLRAAFAMLVGALAGQAGTAAGIEYPPPPGSYRSEVPALADLPQPPTLEIQVRPDDGMPPSDGGSRLLPLPDDAFDSQPGAYDAAKLFGSAPPVSQPPQGGDPAGPRFTPPADPYPAHNDFSMNFDSGRQPPSFEQDYYRHPPGEYQQHPQYAPTYPGYQQYPGQRMDYAPLAAEPGHPVYMEHYGPAYPQADRDSMPAQDYYPAADPLAPAYAPEGYYAPGYSQDYYPADSTFPEQGYVTGSTFDAPAFPSGATIVPNAPELPPLPATGGNAIFRPAE